jgi:rod shape-determining protein MreC
MLMALRWLSRYGLQITLLGGLLGVVWLLRQTQGALLAEIYYQLSRPFHPGPPPRDWVIQAQTTELQQRLLELENQNRVLRQQLGETPAGRQPGILAPIIGRSSENWWQEILLGRGSLTGIKNNDIVTSAGGLVGRITAVSPNTSRVTLISDPASSVGVMVSRSRSQGYIRGQGRNQVILRFFDKDPQVQAGDTIVTAPTSSLFPAGIPVGVIQQVHLDSIPVPEALVRLTAPVNQLEWVRVQRAIALRPAPSPAKTNPVKLTPPPVAQP